jgi:protein phosphatase
MRSNVQTRRIETLEIDPYDIAGDTHTGLIRESNEDSYAYYADSPDNSFAFIAVADGIGGHENGDIASNFCVRKLLSSWRDRKAHKIISEKEAVDFLRNEIIAANKSINDLNNKFNVQHPMGTTIVSAILLPKSIVVAHAGDSRCYRMREGVLERLTEDHSFVAELLKQKIIKPEEAQNHPFAHIISRSVGPMVDMEPDISVYRRKSGDCYLFCSDGLTNHIEDVEIEMIMFGASNPYDATRSLMSASLRAGGEDNITIVTVFS